MKSISVGGTDLCCVDRGQGLPVLFVHGFPFDHTMWAGQIDAISSHYRVITPDLRGFGGSRAAIASHDKFTMEQFADDLAAMLDAMEIREPVVFCGLSMGGYVALQFWRKYAQRLRGLILCDTRAAADSPEVAAARLLVADRALADGVGPMVEAMLPKVFAEATRRERPELIESLRRVMLANSPQGVAAASRGMAVRPDMTAALGQIRTPTLVLAGDEDAVSTPAEMRGIARAIAGSHFVEIPAAGHMSPVENPAAVNAAILDFLAMLRRSLSGNR
jgi:3-oxoadipate enol-lactonase